MSGGSIGESEYTSSCVIVTYNCAKLRQDEAKLSLVLSKTLETNSRPDYLVFCLQELAPILDASMGWAEDWLLPFQKVVPSYLSYLGHSLNGACAVLVFTTSPSLSYVLNDDRTSFGYGWSSLKGGALLSIVLPGEKGRLTFVSTHLAANEGKKAKRNRDFKILMDELRLNRLCGQVVVAGDLNYRTTDGSLETDELSQEMRAGNVGRGFVEAPVKFEPTFKFKIGTNSYDKRKRTPSYCDRILLRDVKGLRIHQYDSVERPELDSDHKPVFAVISTPTVIRKDASGHWVSGAGAELDNTAGAAEGTALNNTASHESDVGYVTAAAEPYRPAERNGEEHSAAASIPPPVPMKRPRSWSRLTSYLADSFIGVVLYSVTTRRGRLALAGLLLLAVVSRL